MICLMRKLAEAPKNYDEVAVGCQELDIFHNVKTTGTLEALS